MRRFIVLLAGLCLIIALPASTFGAKPAATTKLTDATAFFTAESGGHCYALTASLLAGSYREVTGTPEPPGYGAQLWTYLSEVDCGNPDSVVVQDMEAWDPVNLPEDPDAYLLNPLTAAYLNQNSGDALSGSGRNFGFRLAWAAYGSTTQRAYPNDNPPSFGREIEAKVAGTVLDSEELEWTLQRGTMSVLTYIFPTPAPEE